MEKKKLDSRIKEEMTVDYENVLEKNFDVAKEFIRITSTGTIDVLGKEKFIGIEKILLYFIGKVYAKEAGLSDSEFTSHKELCQELGIVKGSVLPWVKKLRDEGKLDVKKGKHAIKVNYIESILKKLSEKK